MNYYYFETPIGMMTLGEEKEKLRYCLFGKGVLDGSLQKSAYLIKAYDELLEYFHGQRKIFDLDYDIQGTPFQLKVYQELLHIPYGQTISYKQLAINIGSPKAYRAVGHANHVNNISIFIPCHRVIGTNHRLVGYAGGLEVKKYLLELENASF
ncbi:MAG: methylated-DNA--[protein]-cysteine S-methyltransferase [Erysipelotrichaceae bacterium]|nr:methylated-DNA--[protein]-cysteine S-methyltransferase [Erysipelotrichaceae bacterium]